MGYLSGRCANLGDCAQSCRWSYNLYAEEKNNPGKLLPIEESEYGTSIFSSKDLCLLKEIPEIIDMGIDSLKIEGRLKTEYYLATIIDRIGLKFRWWAENWKKHILSR